MKKFKFLLGVLLIAAATPVFTSCNGDEPNLGQPKYESVSGKFEISDPASPYKSIELGASGNYIVTKRGYSFAPQKRGFIQTALTATRAISHGDVIYGTFSQSENGSFDLEGFGEVNFSENQIHIQPINGNSMTFSSSKATAMESDKWTDALCRTWKLVKMHAKGNDYYEGEYEETYIPDPNNPSDEYLSEVLFSKSGTCLFIYGTSDIEALFWTWENKDDHILRYSYDNVWGNGEDEGNFTVKFDDDKLIIYEYYKDFETDEWYESTVELVEK